jgi:hypothetical protein
MKAEKQALLIDYFLFIISVYGFLPISILTFFAIVLFITDGLLSRLLRFAFLPLIRCPQPGRLYLTLPVAVTFILLLSPLWVFCFGISYSFYKKSFRKSCIKVLPYSNPIRTGKY